jgi:ethanolamine utilization protein EutN
VIGFATSTVRHESLAGLRLAVVQPLDVSDSPAGDPQLCVDRLNAGLGQSVIINSDGKFAREVVGHQKSPVRFVVCAIVD